MKTTSIPKYFRCTSLTVASLFASVKQVQTTEKKIVEKPIKVIDDLKYYNFDLMNEQNKVNADRLSAMPKIGKSHHIYMKSTRFSSTNKCYHNAETKDCKITTIHKNMRGEAAVEKYREKNIDPNKIIIDGKLYTIMS